jgi:major type 1 subunit fimbrin (pilin)
MKKNHILGVAISAAMCVPMAAQASDGTINFTGLLTAQTCTINGGAGKDFTVALPTVSTANFTGAGSVAGATNFAIDVTACTAGVTGYTAYFEANQNIDLTNGKLKNTAAGGAQFVEIELLNAANTATPIDLSKPTGSQGVTAGTFATPTGTSNFIARYYATGATTAGSVASQVTYSLVYN